MSFPGKVAWFVVLVLVPIVVKINMQGYTGEHYWAYFAAQWSIGAIIWGGLIWLISLPRRLWRALFGEEESAKE
jgi:hypothetical protein